MAGTRRSRRGSVADRKRKAQGGSRWPWVIGGIILVAIVAIAGRALLFPASPTLAAPAPNANGQPVDGIPCEISEYVTYHVHAHLNILVDGTPATVPERIGIVDNSCLYFLHTHAPTGVIHVEAPAPGNYTLGQFFDIWGQPLTKDEVAGFKGPVTVYVDGQMYEGDPREITLTNHKDITLAVGEVVPPPPPYDFAGQGL